MSHLLAALRKAGAQSEHEAPLDSIQIAAPGWRDPGSWVEIAPGKMVAIVLGAILLVLLVTAIKLDWIYVEPVGANSEPLASAVTHTATDSVSAGVTEMIALEPASVDRVPLAIGVSSVPNLSFVAELIAEKPVITGLDAPKRQLLAVKTKVVKGLPSIEYSSTDNEEKMPEVELDGHIYVAGKPTMMRAFIGGKAWRVGEKLPNDVLIYAVRADSVELRWRGQSKHVRIEP